MIYNLELVKCALAQGFFDYDYLSDFYNLHSRQKIDFLYMNLLLDLMEIVDEEMVEEEEK